MQTTVIDNIKGSEIPLNWLTKTRKKPENLFKITIEVMEVEKPKEKEKKEKWINMLEDFKKNPLNQEAKESLDKASKSFREDFILRDASNFTN